jgi:hypothetical protein
MSRHEAVWRRLLGPSGLAIGAWRERDLTQGVVLTVFGVAA